MEVKADGKLECRRLDNPTVVAPQSEWSVTLESKALESANEVVSVQFEVEQHQHKQTYPIIDAADVPRKVTLKSTNDDLLIEYTVWVWIIARNNGVHQPVQRTIGRLIEGIDGIEAYKPGSVYRKIFGRTNELNVVCIN